MPERRIDRFVVKIRELASKLLDAHSWWGLAAALGFPSLSLVVLRDLWGWWSQQDPVSQVLVFVGGFLFLGALSVTAWELWGVKALAWLQARTFPVVVLPEVGNGCIWLKVKNRRESDRFKAALRSTPGGSAGPAPPLCWRESEGEFRQIVKDYAETILFARFEFLPQEDPPLFAFSVPTVSGEEVKGKAKLYRNADGTLSHEAGFRVAVAGERMGLVDQFEVTVKTELTPNHPRFDRAVKVKVDPAPGIASEVFQASRAFGRGESGTDFEDGYWDDVSVALDVRREGPSR